MVLVTGGAGFLGSHLVEALVNEGAQVRVLDNLSTGKRENLAGLPVEFIEGDIADREVVETAVSGCHTIFHQAALVSVPLSIKEPLRNHLSNVNGTFNVFDAAREAGVRRVVYASSAAVYGNLPKLPKQESDPLAAITPYAAAKQMSEVMAGAYAASYGLELVGLRYMNIFGPRQDPSSPYSGVLSIFCRRAMQGQGVKIFGDGEQTRDFVYVGDVVQANLRAARASVLKLVNGEATTAVFNVGRGEQTSLNQVVAYLRRITGHDLPISYGPDREGDIKHSYADISRARHILGYQPQTSILDGLRQTLAWFEETERVLA